LARRSPSSAVLSLSVMQKSSWAQQGARRKL
jgi:hypothetical protein